MNAERIVTVSAGLIRPPWRLIVQSEVSPTQQRFDVRRFSTLRDFMMGLLTILIVTRSDFMSRLASLETDKWQKSKHKVRPYVAERVDLLYMNRPSLEKHSFNFSGYWIATNLGHKEVSSLVHQACTAAGVPYQSIATLKL